MLRTLLLGKIHRATITQTELDYVGSITIDRDLFEAVGMKEWEKVEIFNINNGNRFETYIIPGERGSGIIGINGAAARLVHVGDKIIIVNYGLFAPEEMQNHQPQVVILDGRNKIMELVN